MESGHSIVPSDITEDSRDSSHCDSPIMTAGIVRIVHCDSLIALVHIVECELSFLR